MHRKLTIEEIVMETGKKILEDVMGSSTGELPSKWVALILAMLIRISAVLSGHSTSQQIVIL